MLTLLWIFFACQRSPSTSEPAAPEAKRRSIVLVTLDTTRADRLGVYGHAPARTPVVDGLAKGGVRFERAYATVPLTTPSHASILTGLYPPRHGIRNNGDAVLSDDAVTLAERLKGEGYQTAAAISAFVTTRVWNLDQGFDTYFDDITAKAGSRWTQERPAEQVVDDLIGWLDADERTDAPFFIWAHFYDPHHPYAPPPPFDTEFADPYDGELAYADAQLGRLKAAVDAAGGAHWIVVADHGEAIHKEHGESTHGLFVFDPTMRVPFIIHPAEPLDAPVVQSTATVSIVDVTPTAMGLAGLPPDDSLDGVDLSAAWMKPMERAAVYMESLTPQQRFGYHPEIAAAQGPLKLIDTPTPRLFDVVADPEESKNLLSDRPAEVEQLRAAAQQAWARTALSEQETVSPETMEQLAVLGYISNDFGLSEEVSQIDAKDRTDIISEMERIRALTTERDFAAAEAAYRELLEKEPQMAEARMALGRALSAQGKETDAEQVYREALAMYPKSTVLRVNLANSLAAQDRQAEGLEEMRQVLAQVPGDDIARTGMMRMLTDLGRRDEGIPMARSWLLDNPSNTGIKAHLGVMLFQEGEYAEAWDLLEASLEDDVPRQLVHRAMGLIEASRNHPAQAIAHLRIEQELFGDARSYRESAGILMVMQRWEEAADDYASFLDAFPDDIDGRLGQAQAIFNTGDYELAQEILAPGMVAAPNNPDVLLLQANILAKIGDRAEAEAMAKRANALHQQRLERTRPR
ncbi:MAG: sulfatase-like hydrolase/transferase [Myxococcota bacterium]